MIGLAGELTALFKGQLVGSMLLLSFCMLLVLPPKKGFVSLRVHALGEESCSVATCVVSGDCDGKEVGGERFA